MNYSDFEGRPYIKDTLVSDGYILTGAEIMGSLSFNESVNAGEDLNFGSCIISTLNFQLSNMNYAINDLTDREFIWKQAVRTESNPYQRFIRAARSKLVCVNGAFAYVVSEREPYLSVWDFIACTKIKDAPEQPDQSVGGLAVIDDRLYCLHSKAPYLTAYTISEQGLMTSTAPTLNEFETSKIEHLCGQGYSCNVQGNTLKEYVVDLYDLKPDILIETVFEYIQMGIFIAEKPVKVNSTLVKVSCSDRLKKFDVYVDDWVNTVKHPITIKNYLLSLCERVGVEFANSDFLNRDFVIQKNYRSQNVTGLQALRWIAEASVRFGRMDEQGRLALDWYSPVDYSVDDSIYESASVEEYTTAKIEKLQIRVVENDIGVIVPADDPNKANTYVIENNPLLYAETDAELRPAAKAIYDAIKDFSYQPYKVRISRNAMLRAGQVITVANSGKAFPAYIMSRSMKGQMDELTAVGNPVRATQTNAINQQIQQLRGSVHEFTVNIESLNSKITGYDETIDGLETHFSELEQTVGGFKLAVDNHKLTFDKNGLTIYNGGFRIKNGKEDIFSIDSSGEGVTMKGSLYTKMGSHEVWVTDGSIMFMENGKTAGLIMGTVVGGKPMISISDLFSVKTNSLDALSIDCQTEIRTNSLTVSNSGIWVYGDFFYPITIRVSSVLTAKVLGQYTT